MVTLTLLYMSVAKSSYALHATFLAVGHYMYMQWWLPKFCKATTSIVWTRKPQASLKLVLAPTGLTRDNGSGAMPKLHTCRLAHAHLVFALVITNRITLWAHFVHTYMDTPPLTTYMYMYMLYTILLVSWPSPYTVAFSLYSWPSPYRWPSPYIVGLP